MPIQIIDLFAGPGGLGEGFSSLRDGQAFEIMLSAEMESSAHATLRLRSFFRHLKKSGQDLSCYYNFCNGDEARTLAEGNPAAWEAAVNEARQITLGSPDGNAELDGLLDLRIDQTRNCVLIGGPPCQAYSLVGRARNQGKTDYRAEDDHRHFLYREYLRIIQARRPAVFVMENVKGILSSQVGGEKIFNNILRDLVDPTASLYGTAGGTRYRIHSLVKQTCFEHGMSPEEFDPRDFIVRAEEYGIPQARHRVILLGIRADLPREYSPLVKAPYPVVLRDVLADLPKLRSRLSKETDSTESWLKVVGEHYEELASDASHQGMDGLSSVLNSYAGQALQPLNCGALRLHKHSSTELPHPELASWYSDSRLKVWLNSEARGHMTSDLRRYAFAASYAQHHNISPKGHEHFVLNGLRPNHDNWETGKFADRFRVQVADRPSTTITSHIAKDGHYFIHPDPAQCRSLTVREAARLQTFPDNYFFLGNRTQQFHQVGNAVPPLLAKKIAAVVDQILHTAEFGTN